MLDTERPGADVFFAGAGGSSLGLELAGYRTTGYEKLAAAIESHRANGMTCHAIDLSDPANDHLIVASGLLAWFSPPCQPFSDGGLKRGMFDPRDGIPWSLRLIEQHRWPVIVIENVVGLTYARHRPYLEHVIGLIEKLGYTVDWRIINCADHGLAQTRRRLIIIGRRDDQPITWPTPTHTETPDLFQQSWVTMRQALTGVDGVSPAWVPGVVLNSNADRGRGCLERHGDRPKTSIDQPAPAMVTRPDTRWRWEHPDGSQHIVTVPELCVLQGFPPDYRLTGSKTAIARQLGNAVPPPIATALALENQPVGVRLAA